MNKPFFITLAWLILNSHPSAAGGPIDRSQWTEKEFWAETKLKFEAAAERGIGTHSCLMDFSHFLGCANGLSAGVAAAADDGKDYFAMPSQGDSRIRGFDVVGIEFKDYEEMKARVVDYEWSLKRWYDQNGAYLVAPVNFDLAFADFRRQYMDSSNESYLTAKIINAFLEKVMDPHSRLLPTHYYDAPSSGAEVMERIFGFYDSPVTFQGEEKWLVTKVVKGSPFERVGISEGDIVLSVDGNGNLKTMKKKLEKLKNAKFEVMGPKGRRTVSLTRARVDVDLVESSLERSQSGKPFGHIKFSSFLDISGCTKILKAGKDLLQRGALGLILDLRGNEGGDVLVAQCINKHFLELNSRTFVFQDLKSKRFIIETNHERRGVFAGIHNVVLIDGDSASASELVSLQLQGYRKAFIVGERSYGKGTMQAITGTSNPLVKFARTIAKFFGPQGVSPQLQGVIPDFEAWPSFTQTKPTTYEREGDLASNALLGALVPPPKMDERVGEIKAIKKCLTEGRIADLAYERLNEFKRRVHDNQKAVALGVLDCALKNRLPVFSGLDIPQI